MVLRGEDTRGKAAISEGEVVEGAAGWGCGAGQVAPLGEMGAMGRRHHVWGGR